MIACITKEVNDTVSAMNNAIATLAGIKIESLSKNELYKLQQLLDKIKDTTKDVDNIVSEKMTSIEYMERPIEYREYGSKQYGGKWININTLPVGTSFYVHNGSWVGRIVLDKQGNKCIQNAENIIQIVKGYADWESIDIIDSQAESELDC